MCRRMYLRNQFFTLLMGGSRGGQGRLVLIHLTRNAACPPQTRIASAPPKCWVNSIVQQLTNKKTTEQSRRITRWSMSFSTWSDRRGFQLVSQANCFRRFTSVRIRSASRAASNGFRNVSLNTERSKPDALSSSLRRPIRTVSLNSAFRRRF